LRRKLANRAIFRHEGQECQHRRRQDDDLEEEQEKVTTDLRPYPKYKDSGLTWLGDIPEHWQTRRLKFLVQNVNEQVSTRQPDEVYIALEHVERWTGRINLPNGNIEFDSQVKRFRPGDVLFGKLRPYLAKVTRPVIPGVCVGEFFVLRGIDEELLPEFLEQELRSKRFIDIINSSTFGAKMPRADWTFVGNLVIVYPPAHAEQLAITHYLDGMDRKIRRFIRNRRRLIEVLNEQKQAVINRAVTRGLDPNAPLKPSGIVWLGDIPEHWEVKRLKHLLVQPLKYGANAAAEHADRTLPRYIRITDIDKDGQLINDRFRSIAHETAEPYMLQDGDILLARSGATVGKAFLYTDDVGPAAHAGYLIKARVDAATIRPRFLYALLQSAGYWRWIASMTIQATIQNVNAEKYANLCVTLPPKHEQDAILEAIKVDTAALASVINTTKREIDLIREYRARLITDVVTGKIDVRGLAPAKPFPADEQIDEGVDDEEMLEDGEPELAEETTDADD
jgi:type I restriction enzyme S subunit